MKFSWHNFRLSILVLLTVVPVFFAHAAAGVPLLINFQGRLYDSSDNLLGGTGTDYCFKFSIYDASSGGSKIWPTGSPTPDTLNVRNGVFDASIGNTDTLDLTFTDDQAYVDVAVSSKSGTCDVGETGESYETLSPRPRIVSSGFAINARTVGGFTPAQSATNNQIPVLTSGQLILSHATAAGLASTGSNPLTLDAGSSGVLNLNNNSTGNILLGGGSSSTGCTLTNSTGAFACSAGLTGTTLTSTSGDLTLGAAGVQLTAADGVLTLLGLGNGNDENLTIDLDNASANNVTVASGTGVSNINFTSIGSTWGSNVLPGTNDSHSLGSTSARWSNLYLGANSIFIGTSATDEGTISYNTTTNILNFGTDSTTNGDIAFFTDDLFLDKSSGFVGVNNSAPAERFTVSDGVILSNYGSSSTPSELGGVSPNIAVNSVFVSGKYAYLGLDSDGGAGNEFRIIDIHNPSSIPSPVGGISYNFNFNAVYVSGNYAYAGTSVDGSGNELRIYDVTNPSSPSLTGSVDVAEDITSLVVVGRYLYLTKTDNNGTCSGTTLTGCEFSIYDVINPASPTAIGGADFVDGGTHYSGRGVYVQGKYAYVVRNDSAGTCSGTTVTGCEFIIFDISNPFSPSATNGVSFPQDGDSVFVSGAFAYLGLDTNTGNEFRIYNISNPSSISSEVGGIEIGFDINAIKNYGKYVYLTTGISAGTAEVRIVDVSNTASPSVVGSIETSIATQDVFVSGKYLYLGMNTVSGNEFRVYDISGVEAPAGSFGTLAVGSVSVSEDAGVDNNLHVGNAINVGVGGINSAGSIVINNDMVGDGSTTAIPGIFGNYTFSPTAGGTQVGNRFVINNAPTTNANTSVGQIVRTIDNTALANLVRGIEIVSNAGSNTAGTNTGLRATGATFGVQGITNGAAGAVALPAALYGESTGTTQGDILRLYTQTMTSAPAIAQIYHDTSTFSGAAILIDMAVGSGSFTGNFLDFQENNVQRFLVTDQGVTSMGLSATSSSTAVCSSLANATSPTAGTAYEIRDCSSSPTADYAEMYPVEEGIDFGDIVVTGTKMIKTYGELNGSVDWNTEIGDITQLVKSHESYQKNVIGIVSNNFGDFTSAGHNIKEEDNPMPVALNGRVPVKVASYSEAIVPGDYITTSTELGRGMKALESGTVIGKALGFWTPGNGVDTVMVFVEQGYYDGTQFASSAEVLVSGLDFPESGSSWTEWEAFLSENTGATPAGLDFADLIKSGLTAGLDMVAANLAAGAITASAIDITDQANFSGLTFFSGPVEFLEEVKFSGDVLFETRPTFNKDTAGFALIKEGDQSVRVEFEEAYSVTPVVTATMSFEATDNIDDVTASDIFNANISYIVNKKDETGFTITLNKPANHNLRFSWIALGVKDAGLFESLGEGLEFITEDPSDVSPGPAVPEVFSDPDPEPEDENVIIEGSVGTEEINEGPADVETEESNEPEEETEVEQEEVAPEPVPEAELESQE